MASQGIQGAGLDQTLNDPFVHHPQVDLFAEFENGAEPGDPLPGLQYGGDGIGPDVFDGSQAEANLRPGWREVQVADVDVGRKDLYAQVPAFVDVFHYLVAVVDLAGQQSRHEADRIVGLQVSGLVGQDRVGGRVRLVESVAGKLDHQVEYSRGLPRIESAGSGAGNEFFTLGFHLLLLFLSHGAPQEVSLSQ